MYPYHDLDFVKHSGDVIDWGQLSLPVSAEAP